MKTPQRGDKVSKYNFDTKEWDHNGKLKRPFKYFHKYGHPPLFRTIESKLGDMPKDVIIQDSPDFKPKEYLLLTNSSTVIMRGDEYSTGSEWRKTGAVGFRINQLSGNCKFRRPREV